MEWFAARRPEIAKAQRAADRKKMIAALEKAADPLAEAFAEASERAVFAAHMARASGDYPLLSGGDVNLYSLFVERAMTLVNPQGMVGLLTPSGIASDKTAAKFFKGVATEGRLRALYDFENRRTRYKGKPFFPDVDSRFKFCAFIASSRPTENPAQCAFFLQDVAELDDPKRCFPLTAQDFARRQSEHRHCSHLPLTAGCGIDDGNLFVPAGSSRSLEGRGSQGVARAVFYHVSHDQRL